MKTQPGKYHRRTGETLTAILVFLFAGIWFYFPGKYVLIANEDLSLFEFGFAHFRSFLDRPGGFIEYAGSFLNQFYRFRLAGALLLALFTGASFFAARSLINKISGKQLTLIGGVVAALLLMAMHNYYLHQLSHSLGILLSLSLAASMPRGRRDRSFFLALALPGF